MFPKNNKTKKPFNLKMTGKKNAVQKKTITISKKAICVWANVTIKDENYRWCSTESDYICYLCYKCVPNLRTANKYTVNSYILT